MFVVLLQPADSTVCIDSDDTATHITDAVWGIVVIQLCPRLSHRLACPTVAVPTRAVAFT